MYLSNHPTYSAYEILFSNAATGAQVTDGATRLLDEQWASWTCTLGEYVLPNVVR
jgi:hypothetical protein